MCHGSLYDPYGHHIGFVDNFYTKLGSAQMNLEMEERSSSIRVIFCVTVRVTGVFGSGKSRRSILCATCTGLTV